MSACFTTPSCLLGRVGRQAPDELALQGCHAGRCNRAVSYICIELGLLSLKECTDSLIDSLLAEDDDAQAVVALRFSF